MRFRSGPATVTGDAPRSASHRRAQPPQAPTALREGARGSARKPGDLPPTKPTSPRGKGSAHVFHFSPHVRSRCRARGFPVLLRSRARLRILFGDREGRGRNAHARGPGRGADPGSPGQRERQSRTHVRRRQRPRCARSRHGRELGRGMVRRLRLRDRLRRSARATRSAAGATGRSGFSTAPRNPGCARSSHPNPAPNCCCSRARNPNPANVRPPLGYRRPRRRTSAKR